MGRYIQPGEVNPDQSLLPIEKGGTATKTVAEFKAKLPVVQSSTVDQPSGPVSLNAQGTVDVAKFSLNNKVNINGSLSVIATQTVEYQITDFDSFKTYTIAVSAGSVSRIGDTITFASPSTAQVVNMVINGKSYSIDVLVAAPVKPSIVAPVANAVVASTSYQITSSPFSAFGDGSLHSASDWQLSVNSDMSSPVVNAVNDTVNKTSYNLTGLTDTTIYYARVRYRGSNGNYSSWSDVQVFSIAIPVPAAPAITTPVNNATGVDATATVNASAFAAISDNSTHASSDWVIATDALFNNVVKTSSNDTVNKTAWSYTGLASDTTHYVRVRYRSTNGKVSNWSPTVTFRTLAQFVFSPVIGSTVTNYNMRNAAIVAGWNQITPLIMSVTVGSGITVGSAGTNDYAFTTGVGFPTGSQLSLINNGTIIGAGGRGGGGGAGPGIGGGNNAGGGGANGGPGLGVLHTLTVTNNGIIGGGGGGGGGGGSGTATSGNSGVPGMPGGGGGGGAGYYVGTGGLGGNENGVAGGPGSPGVSGSFTSGGLGGSGGSGGYTPGGNGGNGGSVGANGTSGSNGPVFSEGVAPGYGGAGGAAGSAIAGSVRIIWAAVGTIAGRQD